MSNPAAIWNSVEPGSLRALRLVALGEGVSFALLLVCSVLKRTTDLDLVPVLGPIHGILFVLYVGLVVQNWTRLRWGVLFAAVMLTVGSPGAHFAIAATDMAPDKGPAGPG